MIRITIFLALLVLIGCQEDETILPTAKVILIKSKYELGAHRLFSNTGEITDFRLNEAIQSDSMMLNNFIKYYTRYGGFFDTLSFSPPNDAYFTNYSLKTNCFTQQEGQTIVLSQKEDQKNCCFSGEVYSKSLTYLIGKIKADIKSEYIVNSAFGNYTFGFLGKTKYAVTKVGNAYAIPLLHFIKKSTTEYTYKYANNLLDDSFYKNLPENTTVLVRQDYILLAPK